MPPEIGSSEALPDGVTRVRAPNPSPMTLDGTNSYVVEGWVVDPGPADQGHVEALLEAAEGRIAGIVLTHDHADHSEAAPLLAQRAGGAAIVKPGGGARVGPLEVLATPGHSPDSVCLLRGHTCFTGDTILGAGSVFVAPGGGALAAYLASLRTLRALDLDTLCPGHGPVVSDAHAVVERYLEHRLDRERRLLAALDAGMRSQDELLDAAWSDVPVELRPAAAVTLAAHMEKLRDEGSLPPDLDD